VTVVPAAGVDCFQARRCSSGMPHKVVGGSFWPAVRLSCLPDASVGLAHCVGLISILSAISA
jgi:hypothetical protein